MHKLNALHKRMTHRVTKDNLSIFLNKDLTVHELNNTAMNERMLQIKALNLILSLLYMFIISLVKPLSYSCLLND